PGALVEPHRRWRHPGALGKLRDPETFHGRQRKHRTQLQGQVRSGRPSRHSHLVNRARSVAEPGPGVRAKPAYMSAEAPHGPVLGRHSVTGTTPGGTSRSPPSRALTWVWLRGITAVGTSLL